MKTILTTQGIVDNYKDVLKPNEVLVTLYDCSIGVATENEKGYTPVPYKAHEYNYTIANEIVKQANSVIHPTMDELLIARIICSTF